MEHNSYLVHLSYHKLGKASTISRTCFLFSNLFNDYLITLSSEYVNFLPKRIPRVPEVTQMKSLQPGNCTAAVVKVNASQTKNHREISRVFTPNGLDLSIKFYSALTRVVSRRLS